MKETMETEYEDNYWAEDVLFMERNSRDFVQRIEKINKNAEAICDLLRRHSKGLSSFWELFEDRFLIG
jgi:cystathionine gamma-synthase